MDPEKIKAIIRNFHEELYNKRNLNAIDEFFAPNYTGHMLASGQKGDRESFKQQAAQMQAQVPVWHMVIDDLIVEGNKAAFRWTWTGTDPQGQEGKYAGISMYTLADGKLVEDYYIASEVKEAQPAA